MIVSFADKATESLYNGGPKRSHQAIPPDIHKAALRKLDMLNAAAQLSDLKAPPGNKLEALVGNLAGFHSIRINEQWRVIFRWQGTDAFDVAITDYH